MVSGCESLHDYIQILDHHIDDRDQLEFLVGYILLNSLRSYQPTTLSPAEMRLQEMRRIHRGFSVAVGKVSEHDGFAYLCELIVKNRSLLDDAQTMQLGNDTGQGLLEHILGYLNNTTVTAQDALKRRARTLINALSPLSHLKTHDQYMHEYYLIHKAFGGNQH